VAQAGAQARSWEERPQTLGRAVEAIGQHPPDPIRRLLVERCTLELSIGLGKGYGTGVLGVPQMPEDTTGDNRGQVYFRCQTVTVLFIGQDIRRQRQPTPGQDRHHTLLPQRTDQTVEGHGGEMADHGAPF
jgi:hypothetical protein